MEPISFVSGFDGWLTLSRREGVDIRPTLLRVLTDLYVPAQQRTRSPKNGSHRIDIAPDREVDRRNRAAVRARLAVYPPRPPKT